VRLNSQTIEPQAWRHQSVQIPLTVQMPCAHSLSLPYTQRHKRYLLEDTRCKFILTLRVSKQPLATTHMWI